MWFLAPAFVIVLEVAGARAEMIVLATVVMVLVLVPRMVLGSISPDSLKELVMSMGVLSSVFERSAFWYTGWGRFGVVNAS